MGDKRDSTVKDWLGYPAALEQVIERLSGVIIENRNALEVMREYDSSDSLHYIDPPYVFSTRDKGKDYRHEMDDVDHKILLEQVKTLQGMVIISGYENEVYSDLLADWMKVSRRALADGGVARTEVLWISPSAANSKGIQMELQV